MKVIYDEFDDLDYEFFNLSMKRSKLKGAGKITIITTPKNHGGIKDEGI